VDADFVQSVAKVGDEVDVQLMTGPPRSGVIVELALGRMVLQQATDARVVLALSGIVAIEQHVPAAMAQIATPDTVRSDAASSASTTASPAGSKFESATEAATEPAREAMLSDLWLGDVLAKIADFPFDISFSITVPAPLRSKLMAAEHRYGNALRINELAPKFGRVQVTGQVFGSAWRVDLPRDRVDHDGRVRRTAALV
jgi:hypothetical protein